MLEEVTTTSRLKSRRKKKSNEESKEMEMTSRKCSRKGS